jgi:hypothetical protein
VKRFSAYLLYIAGWIGITVMYIYSTQLEDPIHLNPFKWYKQHRMAHMEAADEGIPDGTLFVFAGHHHHHYKKHKHFAPVSKNKTSHKESHVRNLMSGLYTDLDNNAPEAELSGSRQYVNYMKNSYYYLFFKEINPPPPKLC